MGEKNGVISALVKEIKHFEPYLEEYILPVWMEQASLRRNHIHFDLSSSWTD